ncbi:MAG: PorP/SprF family type IX secretion system membrane protein [Crocinitomicaceae bacterium]|jgi:type IX secretion system PorP/SprF family membrane protein|tara:strand:- start:2543 stop:3553 length:1011 start_codon:yes stop_codon:yes gene_type:complete
MKKIVFAFFALVIGNVFSQQDKSISMWYHSPMMYNAGSIATGQEDFGFFTNFRYQWLAVSDKPIRTNIINASFKIPDGFLGTNNFGIGLNVMNDQTGTLGFTTNTISVPINYTLALDRRNKLSIGISPGFYQQSYTSSGQTWEDQWTGSSFNPALNTEPSLGLSYATIDISTGVFYQHSMRNRTLLYGGVGLNHVNKQKINFSFGGDRLYMQTVVHAGANIVTKKRDLRINPQIMYFKTGPGSNLVGGVSLEHILKEGSAITNINKTVTVDYGFYYRHRDALITTFGFKIKGFKMGVSFDANLSYFNQATNSIGAVEIYIKTLHLYNNSNKRGKIK